MIRLFGFVLFFATGAQASITQAPPSFPYSNGTAVFVDFEKAHYHLVYDLDQKIVNVESEIVFKAATAGFPLFDLVPNPTDVTLDGQAVKVVAQADPSKTTTYRLIEQTVSVGTHVLRMKHRFKENVNFGSGTVASAFWTSDLDDRQYLELYLPTSFEYDAYAMSLSIEIAGKGAQDHLLIANGAVKKLSKNQYELTYPDFYTCSSMYFHLFPQAGVRLKYFTYPSVDGRKLPVTIYVSNFESVDRYWEKAQKVLAELEGDYGAFPHEQVIIYGAGSGGMEYSGATMSDLSSLGHELFHSYNARSVMPANGNSGWMDEALSSWRDNSYMLNNRLNYASSQMAGHSKWTRLTDMAAYSRGFAFMAWLAARFDKKGLNFKTYLKEYFTKHRHSTMTTEEFRDEVSLYSGFDLKKDFDTYVFGVHQKFSDPAELPNPYHPKRTKEELRALLQP